jgi:hypothetical protein
MQAGEIVRPVLIKASDSLKYIARLELELEKRGVFFAVLPTILSTADETINEIKNHLKNEPTN